MKNGYTEVVDVLCRVLVITIAAEMAVKNGTVRGPGTFLAALIDELASLKDEDIRDRAKIRVI